MSEGDLWQWVRGQLVEAGADFTRVENLLEVGTPDVTYCLPGGVEGWLELKHVHKWPAREGTRVRVKFEPGQVPWLLDRAARGGRVRLLVRVGWGNYLFDAMGALRVSGGLSRAEFEEMSIHVRTGELIALL